MADGTFTPLVGKRILAWAGGVLLLIAATMLGVGLLVGVDGEAVPVPAGGSVPEPRLQVDGGEDLRALRAEKRARLNAYGWVDRAGGIAHIPIRRAIELMAGRPVAGSPATGARQ